MPLFEVLEFKNPFLNRTHANFAIGWRRGYSFAAADLNPGKFGNSLPFEDVRRTKIDSHLLGSCDNLDAKKRVASQFEKIVVNADLCNPQDLLPYGSDLGFQAGFRGDVRRLDQRASMVRRNSSGRVESFDNTGACQFTHFSHAGLKVHSRYADLGEAGSIQHPSEYFRSFVRCQGSIVFRTNVPSCVSGAVHSRMVRPSYLTFQKGYIRGLLAVVTREGGGTHSRLAVSEIWPSQNEVIDG